MAKQLYYHYCSIDTMIKILTNHTLRLSNVRRTNDEKEFIYIQDLIEELVNEDEKTSEKIKKMKESKNDKITKKRFVRKKMKLKKNNIPKEMKQFADLNGIYTIYFISFCKENDLLSQWRGYADNASGAAIGFDLSNISFIHAQKDERVYPYNCLRIDKEWDSINTILEELNKIDIESTICAEYEGVGPLMLPTVYDRERQKKLLCALANEINENKAYESYKKKYYRIKLLIYAAMFKTDFFEEEKEARIIFAVPSKKRAESIKIECSFRETKLGEKKYMERDNRLVDYIDAHFINNKNIKKKTKEKNVIKEIWLGPKCKISEEDNILEELLDNENFMGVDVKKSKGSYR